MAITQGTQMGRMVKFECDATASRPSDDSDRPVVYVVAVDGSEAINQPYRFRIELVSEDPDIDSAKVLRSSGRLGLKEKTMYLDTDGSLKSTIPTFWHHGMVASFEAVAQDAHWARYRVVLVPRLWKLSVGLSNRIFLGRTVPQIVEDVLKAHGFGKGDYEFHKPSRPYPKRDYVVQYQESSLQFLTRLLEHEGMFYFFRQEEDREVLVIADSNAAFLPHRVPSFLPFRPEKTAMDRDFLARAVRRLSFRHDPMPEHAILKDYHDQTPDLSLLAGHPTDAVGHGEKYEFGAHHTTKDEGNKLSEIRAQELKARERLYTGRSDCPSFGAGLTYELAGHPRKDFNREFLLTGVLHTARQDIARGGIVGPSGYTYHNDFTSIPAEVAFRPERLTPRPRIAGTITAKVDGESDGQYAEIDEQGRYKVKLALDVSGRGDGGASSFVRMAQPYAGTGMGMHFPLHKGTEVILTHLNGDPDRPVIAGAVPNPATQSPVIDRNFTQCIVRTGGGNEIVCEDIRDHEYVWMRSPRHDSFLNLGDAHRIGLQDGATLATQLGVSINAGAGVTVAAGCSDHAKGTASARTILKAILAGAGVILPAVTAAGDLGGSAGTAVANLAADVIEEGAGLVAGAQFPAAFVTSPGTAAVASMTAAVLAGGVSATVMGTASASLMSPGMANLTGLLGASVIAARKAELVSSYHDAEVCAKQNVRVIAKRKDILVQAQKGTVQLDAEQDWLVRTYEGKGRISTQKDLAIESREAKKIELRAGKSVIRLENEQITIQADKILIHSNDGANSMQLANERQGFGFYLLAKGTLWLDCRESLLCHAQDTLDLFGKKCINMSAQELVQKNIPKISRGESEEKSPGKSPAPKIRKSPPPPPKESDTANDRPPKDVPPHEAAFGRVNPQKT